MRVSEAKESQRKHWGEVGIDIDTECTCNECYPSPVCVEGDKHIDNVEVKCDCAFDIYNYKGDCLAGK